MANFARAMQLSRPDSRSSQYSTGGRFNSALSAAVKQQQQQQQHAASGTSAEEQLEEVEQKITLTLQAIDANFDHCQRTMARDVMPKVENLARLSNDLLQASQPWLQFFMAVASADDNEEPNIPSATKMSTAQRNELEEQAAKGDITARFPKSPIREANDETESIDLDVEIATPQLTSRFMTQELKMSTPRVGGKRMAEQLSASIRKRARGGGTPMMQQPSGNPRTPASMVRALVNTRAGKHPGSAASAMSKNSSVGTSDLMPETSPPHTITFALPKSRIAGKAPAATAALPEDEDEDDDILDEINSLIRRYDSPKGTRSSVKSSVRSARSMQSVARSDSSYSQEMTQLADKYASPALDAASSAQEVQRVQGLVADMEEMLDEAEASAAAAAKAEDSQQENKQAQPENDYDDDELPSPPKITSNLEQSRVVVPDTYERVRADDVSGAREHNGQRNFGARQPMMMDIEAMDNENMTIGHMSPLALRQQQQQQRAAMGARFSSLQESDEDDPFGPTPARPSAPIGAQRPWANVSSARSLQERGWTERAPESTARSVQEASWNSGALGERSSTFDATATFGSPESDLDPHTRDSRLNASASLVPIDGTTTILPTREMLQQAAEASEAIIEDDDDGGDLVAFDSEQFPPAFQEAPAAQQLRALYDLVCSERERLWKLEDLVGAGLEPLEGVQPSVYGVLLDLLARRRMLRQVADNLWTAH